MLDDKPVADGGGSPPAPASPLPTDPFNIGERFGSLDSRLKTVEANDAARTTWQNETSGTLAALKALFDPSDHPAPTGPEPGSTTPHKDGSPPPPPLQNSNGSTTPDPPAAPAVTTPPNDGAPGSPPQAPANQSLLHRIFGSM